MKLYFDIDTQIDFMLPSGALYVPGAEKLMPLIATLSRAAVSNGGKVISTTCAHDEDDPEFKVWPPHCVLGTVGQQKPCSLLLDKRNIVPKQLVSVDLDIDGADQLILEKGELDLFTNPNIDGLLKGLNPEECIVYGVVTEYCVKYAAMGLLDRGYKVALVKEGIQSLNQADAESFLQAFAARPGASFYRAS